MTEAEAKELLIDEDTFLTCGVHIGTKQKSKDMEPYVYKVRDDGLRILNVNLTSEKITEAANFLKPILSSPSSTQAKRISIVRGRSITVLGELIRLFSWMLISFILLNIIYQIYLVKKIYFYKTVFVI